MATEYFDYESFAQSMKEQATDLLPNDISDENKHYIETTICNFVFMSGESLCNDQTIDFSKENGIFICQVIAEWTFHKCVDLVHSAIPKEYWDSILNKIAFAIFEVAKQCIIRGIEQEQILSAVEHQVNKVWKKCVEDLSEKNIIPDSAADIAKDLSNIDDMAKKAGENERVAKLERIYNSEDAEKKLYKISIFKQFFNIVTEKISELFPSVKLIICEIIYVSAPAAILVCGFMILDRINFLTEILEHKTIMYVIIIILTVIITIFVRHKILEKTVQKELQILESIRLRINSLGTPNLYNRLGVDTITLTIGTGLLQISDINQEGELLPIITAMRQALADELGYIVPKIRIIDSNELEEYEYTVSIRENLVGSGFVYPSKYMVIADQWDSYNEHIPEDAIVSVDPTYQTQAYWISRSDAVANKKITAVDAFDVIKTHLHEMLIKHVDDVISLEDVQKLINFVNKKEPRYYKDIKKNGLTDYDLKKIFINLIREKVSIKDILFVFEKLCEYSKFSNDYIVLSERLRAAFGRQICLKNVKEDHVLYAVTLSQDWENTLDESVQKTELGIMFLIEPDTVHNLTETTAMTLMKAHQQIGHQPVILCSHKIRLPLYQLLVRHIPTIVVISYSELITDIKVENICAIGEEI